MPTAAKTIRATYDPVTLTIRPTMTGTTMPDICPPEIHAPGKETRLLAADQECRQCPVHATRMQEEKRRRQQGYDYGFRMHEGDQEHRDGREPGGNAEQRAVYCLGGAGFVQEMIQQLAARRLTAETGEEDQE